LGEQEKLLADHARKDEINLDKTEGKSSSDESRGNFL
jgi:hypothetical protein